MVRRGERDVLKRGGRIEEEVEDGVRGHRNGGEWGGNKKGGRIGDKYSRGEGGGEMWDKKGGKREDCLPGKNAFSPSEHFRFT